MRRSILLVVLLSGGCHTTVFRSESEPVHIHATRREPAAAARTAQGGSPADGGADPRAPDPGAGR